jgi:molybdopterin-guanine dinucleotide biosynthesis protein A
MEQQAGLPVCGVVLAGGKSRRMGRDKALVDFGGQPLIQRVIQRIRPMCSSLVIVANDTHAYEQFGVPVIPDIFPGKGPLGGIYSALRAAREPHVLAVACDMPFLNRNLLQYLYSISGSYDVVIPRAHDLSSKTPHAGGQAAPNPERKLAKDVDFHPMHGVYSKQCVQAMETRLQSGDLRLVSFVEEVQARIVGPEEIDRFDPRHLSFFSINTPIDLQIAQALQGLDEGDVAGAL